MGALFIFILISLLVVSALLFFNKGEKAQEIKNILKDLFSNFKKLFLIVKELIQAKLEQEPTQLKDESTASQPEVTAEAEATAEPEVIPEQEVKSNSELETPSEESIKEENTDKKEIDF